MPAARLNPDTHRRLQRLAEETGKSQSELLDSALSALEREQFFVALDHGFARLHSDPEAAEQERREREEWDSTSSDTSVDG